MTIAQLADEYHVSIKTFERRFMSQVGINPKTFLKIVRFQNAIKEIERQGNNNNATLSVSLPKGYFDQSHFIKESKTYTGFTHKKMILKFVPSTTDISNL